MKSIKLLFCGDFAPCRRFENLALERKEIIFGDLLPEIADSDISFVNLEAPLCLDGARIQKNGPHLRAHPDCVEALSKARFDVVGLANNHIMDFGCEGLRETIAACEQADIPYVGAGSNISEARKPLVLERNGVKVAIIAAAEYEFGIATETKAGSAHIDPIDLLEAMDQARNEADLMIVTIHGGNEYHPLPRPGLRKLCRFLVNRGAHAVICHHPHVAGAYEVFQGRPIIYSLGNLIFDHSKPPPGWDTGYVARLTYTGGEDFFCGFELIPYRQAVALGGAQRLSGREKMKFLSELDGYRRIVEDDTLSNAAWEEYVTTKRDYVIMQQYFPFVVRGLGRLSRLISSDKIFLSTEKTRMSKLNMLRCESHLEMLISSVQNHCQKKK